MSKILVLGGSGLVGKAIIAELNKCKEFETYATYFESSVPLMENRSFKLNSEDSDNINSILNTLKPEIVISSLRGNYEKQLLLHTKVAEYLKKVGGRLYFCSTTNVFDKDVSKPHYEEDLPSSSTEYGQFKIECEKKVTEILQHNACILRLPQVWGKDSPRMKQLRKAFTSNEKITIYPNLLINTITDVAIAKKVVYIIQHNLMGIFHLAAEDVINYKEFYSELLKGLNFSSEIIEENFEEEGHFAILSKRNSEFPEQLGVTNKSVIDYLTSG